MVILKKHNKLIRVSIFFFLFTTIFIGLCSTSRAVSTNYEAALNKGTETFIVSQYNERKWEETVDRELEPDDFFKGDSDKIGARSRITIRNVDNYKWDLYDALISIFDIESYIPNDLPNTNVTLLLLTYLSKDYVDIVYPDKYQVWEAITVKWNFETGDFDQNPDEPNNIMPIFKNPANYDDILKDYNDWALTVNSTMIELGIEPFPILNGDDFLWALIESELFTIARPFKSYLTTLVEKLDCKHTKVKQSSLIIEQKGLKDYIVEATFNDQGILSSIAIKNKDDRILYKIIQDNTDVIILVSLAIIAMTVAGITSVILIRNKIINQ